MIRMSLDKETVLPHEVPIKLSPTFSPAISLSEPPQLTKTRPLPPKNGQLPGNSRTTLTASAPAQRITKKRYSVGVAFKGPAKRRRRAISDSQTEHTLPSHFHLGGNIFDPLNLNSLLDEDVNRTSNQETPQCSPLPSRGGDPVEILVPRDITDPLNLKGEGRGEAGGVLLSPLKSRKRHRNRQHGGGGGGGGQKEAIPARLFASTAGLTVQVLTREGSVPVSPLPCELNTAITCREDIAPPPILPRRHTHPPSGHGQKPCNQGDGSQRRRRSTVSTRSAEGASYTVSTATVAQPTRFHTPLVGGARSNRCGGRQPGAAQPPEKKDKRRFQYGNHSRYYGYNGFYGNGQEGRVGLEEDMRLRLLEGDWFRDKMVLDVGCGAGHITLAVARRFNPVHILGVELDEKLVHASKQNVRHFLSHDLVEEEKRRRSSLLFTSSPRKDARRELNEEEEKKNKEEVMDEKGLIEEKNNMEEEKNEDDLIEEVKKNEVELMEEELMEEFQQALCLLSFPLSFRVSRGPLSAPPLLNNHPSPCRFPNNITFIQGDYVSEKEAWPGQGRYDVVMCLGVTKWVHLQAGDGGVVRLFRRAYQSLSPGGMFILEPQPWRRYSHSKRASETTYHNYRNVRLRPEQFTCYLMESVGFTSYRLLKHTGNQRPIYLFHKGPAQRK